MTNPVIDHKKEEENCNDDPKVLSTGIVAEIIPVGATLIDEIVARILPPEVPKFMNEEKERLEENPNDPEYLKAVQEYERKRTVAAMDAMIMFGVKIQSLPENEEWLSKLKFMERRGYLDLSDYDLEDPMDLEFVFKKYVAVGTQDLIEIGQKAGLGGADVERASRAFPSK